MGDLGSAAQRIRKAERGGPQEVSLVTQFSSGTKYARRLQCVEDFPYILQYCVKLNRSLVKVFRHVTCMIVCLKHNKE